MNRQSARALGSLALVGALVTWAGPPAAAQTFSSGSTGVDGPFNPTSSTTLALPPNGIFNFTTINIPAGVTVRFTRNAANTPVVLLATGNVVINGVLDLSGSDATTYGRPGPGGPGGFDGGAGADGVTAGTGGFGLGPGGGGGGTGSASGGGGGGSPGPGGPSYGSTALRPIVGGSGGGGGGATVGSGVGGGGGGGGGALVIASSTSITTYNTVIRANGGLGGYEVGAGAAGAAARAGPSGWWRLRSPATAPSWPRAVGQGR